MLPMPTRLHRYYGAGFTHCNKNLYENKQQGGFSMSSLTYGRNRPAAPFGFL